LRTSLLVLAAFAALIAGACGKKPAPAPAPVAAPAPTPGKPAPPAPPPRLTGAQMVRLEADFATAREMAKAADGWRDEGRALAKTGGQEAANDVWVKAKKKYQEALNLTERWVEGELGEVTDAQVKAYLGRWQDERGAWIKSMSEFGKLHD
jgi:hypothetical protein